MAIDAALAVTRFGLGAGPDEIGSAQHDPKSWLEQQLKPHAVSSFHDENLNGTQHHLQVFFDSQVLGRRARQPAPESIMAFGRHVRQTLIAEVAARSEFGRRTSAPFHERLTRFWANHFSVSSQKFQVSAIAGAYEREAIRPNILGTFSDLAEAAIFHPAMLIYLDNWQSVGPKSIAGRRRGLGLNENLAREVLELHTVTPVSGFSQDDVTEFAMALTGWTVGNPRLGRNHLGETLYLRLTHEPGRRLILNRPYRDTGAEQARAIVRDLSAHPATASHIARKLARHFVADTPPAALVERLTRSFRNTGGNLKELYRALLHSPEAWGVEQNKVKTPDELLTSTSRMIGMSAAFAGRPRDVLNSFAQLPFSAPSPEGWPDTTDAWIGPDSLNKRIEWARQVSSRQSNRDAREFLREALGDLATLQTRQAVAGAESGAQALTLALMSPEFQRR